MQLYGRIAAPAPHAREVMKSPTEGVLFQRLSNRLISAQVNEGGGATNRLQSFMSKRLLSRKSEREYAPSV
ncbi:hypothetical protein D3C79_1069090 [compost metagenome]